MDKKIREAFEQAEYEIRNRKPKIAICYDFDKTLSPDDMQAFTLIPSFGIDKETFWKESNKLAKDNLMDNNLAWMHRLISYSNLKRLPIKRDYFQQIGAEVQLYEGVNTWFDRINQYAMMSGAEIEHYIISSGLKEIIEGSKIATYFRRIYASSYLYSASGVAEWPAQAVNYTNKTQFIFRIAKGCLEEYDESVNKSMPDSKLRIPYSNIIYIGDSATDIPCMRLVKSKGGYSIGVFDPKNNNRKKVFELFNDERLDLFAPADYSENSLIEKYIKQIIDEIMANEAINTERKILSLSADMYKMYSGGTQFLQMMSEKMTENERQHFESQVEAIKEYIDGNID